MDQGLECGADINIVSRNTGDTVLHMAATHGFTEIAEILIKKGFNVNAKEYSDHTPLHEAANSNHTLMMKLLISHGAEIDAQSDYLETPLHVATNQNHVEVVGMLLKCGANPNIKANLRYSVVETSLKLKYNNIFKTIVYHQ